MLTIEECRKHLADTGKNLTDKEIEKLRSELYQIVSMLLDNYYETKSEEDAASSTSLHN